MSWSTHERRKTVHEKPRHIHRRRRPMFGLLPSVETRKVVQKTVFVSQVVEQLTAPITIFTIEINRAKEPRSERQGLTPHRQGNGGQGASLQQHPRRRGRRARQRSKATMARAPRRGRTKRGRCGSIPEDPEHRNELRVPHNFIKAPAQEGTQSKHSASNFANLSQNDLSQSGYGLLFGCLVVCLSFVVCRLSLVVSR